MSKLGIISRQPQTIENLGAVTVICLDKTGTITENKMEVKMIYDFDSDRSLDVKNILQKKRYTAPRAVFYFWAVVDSIKS